MCTSFEAFWETKINEFKEYCMTLERIFVVSKYHCCRHIWQDYYCYKVEENQNGCVVCLFD